LYSSRSPYGRAISEGAHAASLVFEIGDLVPECKMAPGPLVDRKRFKGTFDKNEKRILGRLYYEHVKESLKLG
jgi:hypothetical protein